MVNLKAIVCDAIFYDRKKFMILIYEPLKKFIANEIHFFRNKQTLTNWFSLLIFNASELLFKIFSAMISLKDIPQGSSKNDVKQLYATYETSFHHHAF